MKMRRRIRKPSRRGAGLLGPALALFVFGLVPACSDDSGSGGNETPDAGRIWDAAQDRDAAGGEDASRLPDGGFEDSGTQVDGGGGHCPDLTPPQNLTRGMAWVRSQPMFISGLVPSMGVPSQSFADGYLDDFGANAVHLWENGLPTEAEGWMTARPDTRFVSWTLADGTAAGSGGQLLGGYQPGAGRIGYQIWDEPRTMDDVLAIEAGVQAVRAADPDALIIINFGQVEDHSAPGEGGDMDDMIAYVIDHHLADVLSHDSYSLQNSGFVRLEGFRQLGLDAGLPYWRYLRSYVNSPSDDPPSQADLRWHAMLGVTYGYTGHSWFVYQIGTQHQPIESVFFTEPGNQDAARTQQFDWAAAVNRDLTYYGRVLPQLTSLGVRHLSTNSLLTIDAVQDWSESEGIDPYLSQVEITDGFRFLGNLAQEILLGFFKDDADRRYIVVQNLNRDGRSTVGNHDDAKVRLSFDFSSAPPEIRRDRLERLDPASQSVVPVPLVTQGDQGSVELTIPAGDVVFLRYDDGCPWAGL